MGIIKLTSKDGLTYEFEEPVIRVSKMIDTMLDSFPEEAKDNAEPIPLKNIEGRILKLVFEWAKHHVGDIALEEAGDTDSRSMDLSDWDEKFLQPLDDSSLFKLITAANFLDIKGLLDVAGKWLAKMIIGKTPEEIRLRFDIKDDFSQEEKEEIRRTNEWVHPKK